LEKGTTHCCNNTLINAKAAMNDRPPTVVFDVNAGLFGIRAGLFGIAVSVDQGVFIVSFNRWFFWQNCQMLFSKRKDCR
jgi:hypothetical protein